MAIDVSVTVAGIPMKVATVSADIGLQASLAYKYQGKNTPATKNVEVVKSALSEDRKTIIAADGSIVTTYGGTEGSSAVQELHVGQTVTLNADYDFCYPSENAIVYFSLVAESGEEIPIAEHPFVTSPQGAGHVSVDWMVPSNEKFVGTNAKNVRIRARVSHDLESSADSSALTFKIFTATDGEVLTPASGSLIKIVLPHWRLPGTPRSSGYLSNAEIPASTALMWMLTRWLLILLERSCRKMAQWRQPITAFRQTRASTLKYWIRHR